MQREKNESLVSLSMHLMMQAQYQLDVLNEQYFCNKIIHYTQNIKEGKLLEQLIMDLYK